MLHCSFFVDCGGAAGQLRHAIANQNKADAATVFVLHVHPFFQCVWVSVMLGIEWVVCGVQQCCPRQRGMRGSSAAGIYSRALCEGLWPAWDTAVLRLVGLEGYGAWLVFERLLAARGCALFWHARGFMRH